MKKLLKQYRQGENGCEISDGYLDAESFVLHLRMNQGMLTVSYGNKMRSSTHIECFRELYLP